MRASCLHGGEHGAGQGGPEQLRRPVEDGGPDADVAAYGEGKRDGRVDVPPGDVGGGEHRDGEPDGLRGGGGQQRRGAVAGRQHPCMSSAVRAR